MVAYRCSLDPFLHNHKIIMISGLLAEIGQSSQLACYSTFRKAYLGQRASRCYRTYFSHLRLKSTMNLVPNASPKPKVFVSRRIPEKGFALLASECDVLSWNHEDPPPRKDYLTAVRGIQGLFCLLTDTIDAELLNEAGPSLRVVSTMSVGYDHIDVQECHKRNIQIGYTPGILTSATAELTVTLLLATSRRIKEGVKAVENGEWGTWKPMWLCGQGLEGATVGIVGLGRIGLAVAKRLKPFDIAQILYCGRSEKPSQALEVGAVFTSFEDLLTRSDFVIACCALTPETHHLFNATAFKQMKQTAIFINSSRGGIVNQDDLYEALKSGKIRAAGLDVTTPEPLPTDSPLLKLDNCLVLPHIGSATQSTREAMAVLAARNLLAGLQGKPMPCQIK
ncbi:glyoxylate reductase/hydroxypyruvate reductase-like isoform X1 [Biomphalaria glabrata]|uniref:Glyoxylate reductase/hydroxypyruvate reductase n=2 Tax=Biomphalaria glabrata TaxID=6526 RepID=A0A9U8DUJ9_BIOGL|nr:glyoxylate reductase/hydroxypyruvate reductase-like isoform X1 [Biomphalaria glabrata]